MDFSAKEHSRLVKRYWSEDFSPWSASVALQVERKTKESDVPSRYSKSFWRTTHDNTYLVADYFHKIYRELQMAEHLASTAWDYIHFQQIANSENFINLILNFMIRSSFHVRISSRIIGGQSNSK